MSDQRQLTREAIGEFIGSPRGVRHYEGMSRDVEGLKQASTFTLSTNNTMENERVLTFDGDFVTMDAGPGDDYTVTLSETGVAPGPYGDATKTTSFTVDEKGRLTAAADHSLITGVKAGTYIDAKSITVNILGQITAIA